MNLKDKIARLHAGFPPNVLDLFSGCGGISLGFAAAGANSSGALDIDPAAMQTWYYNFRKDLLSKLTMNPAFNITDLDPFDFFNNMGISHAAKDIDIICGGPPCQAYSRIGKGKLKSLAGEDAHLYDSRGDLYLDFIRYVKFLKPVAVMIENVPDAINYGGRNVPETICNLLEEEGYVSQWTLIQAANYGVPQYRHRVIIIGIHKLAKAKFTFPLPSNRISLKKMDFHTSRIDLPNASHFQKLEQLDTSMPNAVTTEEAIDDLPVLLPTQYGSMMSPSQNIRTLKEYSRSRNLSNYQSTMRNWLGFSTKNNVSGNVIRYTKRDFPIFARMEEGDQYPEALVIAEKIFTESVKNIEDDSKMPISSIDLKKLHKSIVPPYDPYNFKGKWTKLQRAQPSHTVVAHLQVDTYSHIHYDSAQARGITVREAARLQSFPDGFIFFNTVADAYRLIGNAVPPLLAKAVAQALIFSLRI